MEIIGVSRFRDDVTVSISRLDNRAIGFTVKEHGASFQFQENYAFNLFCEEDFLLAWCADKVVVVDLNNSNCEVFAEDDFISEAFIERDLILVCDTSIVVRELGTWCKKRIYGHPEIIGGGKLDRERKRLFFADAFGDEYFYELENGEVKPKTDAV